MSAGGRATFSREAYGLFGAVSHLCVEFRIVASHCFHMNPISLEFLDSRFDLPDVLFECLGYDPCMGVPDEAV